MSDYDFDRRENKTLVYRSKCDTILAKIQKVKFQEYKVSIYTINENKEIEIESYTFDRFRKARKECLRILDEYHDRRSDINTSGKE